MPQVTEEIISSAERGLYRGVEIERAKKDLCFFAEFVFGYKLAPFHREILNILTDEQKKRVIIMAPRGHGKSSLVSVCYPLWLLGNYRDLRIIICCNAQSQAKEYLRQIESIMLQNKQYREIFGNLVPDPRTITWTDIEKIVLGRSPTATHLSLFALGFRGALLNRRADVIIGDDIIDFESCITEQQREQTKDWFFKTLVPVLEPEGKVIIIGTRWNRQDLYAKLLASWSRSPRSIAKVYKTPQDNGKPLWPERWPLPRLKEEQAEDPIAFACQYRNEPPDIEGGVFRREWLSFYPEDEIPPNLIIFQGVDPSFSAKQVADYFVDITIGVDDKNRIYVLDLVRNHVSMRQQAEIIQEVANRWQPQILNIESTAGQVMLGEYLGSETLLPIRLSPTTKSKLSRFQTLALHFASGRILLPGIREDGDWRPSARIKPLYEEYLSFPNARYDDCLDALEKAIEVATYRGSGYIEIQEPIEEFGEGSTSRVFLQPAENIPRLFPEI